MKKLHTALAVALALGSTATFAEEEEGLYKWVGVYGMYYDVNKDKPEPVGTLLDSIGAGVEAGWKFAPRWGLRAEMTYHNFDAEGATRAQSSDQSGLLYGLDAVYFLDNDDAYIFSGIKILDLDDSYSMLNAGVGRHWNVGERTRIITELAGYYDFGEATKDYSVKIGVAFDFGDSGSASTYSSDAAQTASLAAAEVDSDGDGVVDGSDRCPGTPAGTNVDANGCPMEKDSDRDGVVDSRDKCADTPRGDVVDADGCTRFGERTVTQNVRVLFDHNSAEVKNPDDQQIVALANFMKRYGKANAQIEGHASAPGDADYNMDLSQRRAEAFKNVLVEQYGIAASRLDPRGYGETRLLDTSNTAEAHRVNRRIMVNVSETIKVKLTK